MATFKVCVFKKHQKQNGTFPVNIRLTWKRRSAMIKTEFYATDKQVLSKTHFNEQGKKVTSLILKDPFIIRELNNRIAIYEDLKAKKLGYNIELYNAKELAEYFKKEGAPGTDSSIDFIKFSEAHIKKLILKGKKTTADTLRSTINGILDFTGRKHISITEINLKFLNQFESFLKTKRTIKRTNQFGRITTTERKGLSDVSIMDYMTNIITLFNAAIDEYNDDDKSEYRIKHYPFRKYKLKRGSEPDKRTLTIDEIRRIRDVSDETIKHPRAILARDVFMLSFYCAGMNTADLFDVKRKEYSKGRLSYCRQKTRDRRQDKAFISLHVNPEALPYFEKYRDKKGERVFKFYQMYASFNAFNSNLNEGLKQVAKVCDIDHLTTYYARFSFASIARNDVGISKDDIGLSLNHVDKAQKVTEIYLKKDWSLVDSAVRKVIDYLNLPSLSDPPQNIS